MARTESERDGRTWEKSKHPMMEKEDVSHILVVDDDIVVNTMVTKVLRRAGYRVESAENGESGWNAIRKDPFDLLITDYDMPELNGLDLLRRLRSNSFKFPAILMSASMPLNVGDIIDLVSAGGALHKPFAIKELLIAVGMVLNGGSNAVSNPNLNALRTKGSSSEVGAEFLNADQCNIREIATKLLAAAPTRGEHLDAQPAIFGVCDKMRQSLINLSGEIGFRTILSRALSLSRSNVPWLGPVGISPNGFFEGLRLAESKLTAHDIARGEIEVVSQIVNLLFTFLGEAMTRVLLQEVGIGSSSKS